MCRQVVVQWTTRDAGSPVAQVGTTSGQYSQTAIGVSNTYTRSLMVGEPANTVGYFDPVSCLPIYALPHQHRPASWIWQGGVPRSQEPCHRQSPVWDMEGSTASVCVSSLCSLL